MIYFGRFNSAALLTATACVAASVVGLGTVRGASGKQIAPAAAVAPVTVPTSFAWTDLSGKVYGSAEIAKTKATVFIFASTQCPIAARYAPRIARIAKDYQGQSVAFFLVDSNAADTPKTVATFARERGLTFPVVKDNNTALADQLGANVTPEAVVVDPSGAIAYIGRIDDNADVEKVTRHDLSAALDAIVAGNPVARARTRAFGCGIFRENVTIPTASGVSAKATYARDVAPILNRECVACHRQGDVAPFALETYDEARTWAASIKSYTARRIMPPWKAAPGEGGPFHDSRWLSEKDIATLARWADAGAPMGNKKDLPPAPHLTPVGEWALGKPDVVLQPVGPFHLDAEGRDVYRDFALPIDFDEARYVSAFDFKPGNRAIVHHIIAYIDTNGETVRAKPDQGDNPGWSVAGGGSGIRNEDWGAGWAPGMTPRHLPEGIAVKIPQGAKLVLQVHYHKTGKPETDRSQVALYWAKQPVKQILHTAPVGTPFISLKPGLANQEVKASLTLPFAATIYQVLPHMHMLGTEMKVTATLPDGTTKPIIHVKNWDFNWQLGYRYVDPIELPKGTRLDLTSTYDNTASNPNQPSNPPRLVHFGEQTTDEMCFCFIGFTVNGFPKPAAHADLPDAPKGSL